MPEERDELERAWQALTERERLLQQTMARRSGEIDARARRFDEIAGDLDARRQLIEDAEEELVERERRVSLRGQEGEDRRGGSEGAPSEGGPPPPPGPQVGAHARGTPGRSFRVGGGG